MVYEVVEVEYDDYEFIYEVIKITLKEYIEKIWGWNEDLEHLFFKEEMNEEEAYIIKVDNERVGYLSLAEQKNEIEIENFLLLPKFQNKGLGKDIMKDLIKKSKRKKKKIVLKTFKINERANNFYRKLSFKLTGEDENYFMYELSFEKSK